MAKNKSAKEINSDKQVRQINLKKEKKNSEIMSFVNSVHSL